MIITWKSLTLAFAGLLSIGGFAEAATLQLSIGIRETEAGGGSAGGPIFSNGGTAGGIEFVNRDGQVLNVGGGWQLFTFTPSADTLTAFAGATANSILAGEWGVLEMIRVRNIDGITTPIRLQIDDVSNFDGTSTVTESFDTFAVGNEVMFQEPNFSGSTALNLVAGGTAGVVATSAVSGPQAYEFNMQFVDADPARWARLTTFNTPNLPNPAIRINSTSGVPTISFYARAVEGIPEPSSVVLLGVAFAGILIIRRPWC